MPDTSRPRPPAQLPPSVAVEAVAGAVVVDAEELPDRVELTDDLRARILESVEAGAWRPQAAVAHGVPLGDFERWMLAAQEGRQPYAGLLHDLRRSEAACEDNYLKCIANAAATDWKAASFVLGARFPHRWARGAERGAVGQQSPRADEAVQQFLGLVGRVLDVVAPGVREKLSEGLELYERNAAFGTGAGLEALDGWLTAQRAEIEAMGAPVGEMTPPIPVTAADEPEPALL